MLDPCDVSGANLNQLLFGANSFGICVDKIIILGCSSAWKCRDTNIINIHQKVFFILKKARRAAKIKAGVAEIVLEGFYAIEAFAKVENVFSQGRYIYGTEGSNG